MAKSQWFLDGKPGKAWKVTSPFGYRMHPIRKTKVHHNGTDIWQAKEPSYLEVWHDGVVTVKTTNMASFGHYVVIRHNIDGKKYTTLYAHLASPSKLRKGQRVEAGTVVGKMGATGPVTGKHLHIEIGKGATHPFISGGDGKRYADPMKFIKAVIAKEEAVAEIGQATPVNAPISETPVHSLPEGSTPPAPAVKPKLEVMPRPTAKAPKK